MNSSLQPVIILCLLGVVQALLLALVLLTIRRGNLTANRLLAAVAITISIEVGAIILNSTGSFLIYPHLARINHPLDFLGGPLIFLYARALITKAKLTRKDLLHFVPAVLVAIFLVPYYLQGRPSALSSISESVNWIGTTAPGKFFLDVTFRGPYFPPYEWRLQP